MGYGYCEQGCTFDKKDLVELFRRNDCFNKKCKIEIKELDDKTQIYRSALKIVYIKPWGLFAVTNKDRDIIYKRIRFVIELPLTTKIKYRFNNYNHPEKVFL
jgi:hypothetical protein